MKHSSRFLSLLCVLLVLLFAATAMTGCASTTNTAAPQTEAPTEAPAPTEDQTPSSAELSFTLEVTLPDGTKRTHDVTTSSETVGAALLEEGLIAGDESEYGLYVTTVDGSTLDWDTDHMYWAFYVDGEYAMTGVDSTPILDGATYALVATPG